MHRCLVVALRNLISLVTTGLSNGKSAFDFERIQILHSAREFQLTGDEWNVKAKAVVNATGPFTDSIRLMADPDTTPICQPSAGVHVVLPGYYRLVILI